jgi:hypothetical protein
VDQGVEEDLSVAVGEIQRLMPLNRGPRSIYQYRNTEVSQAPALQCRCALD